MSRVRQLRHLRRLLPAVWLLALLLAPAVAYLAGARQGNVENRLKKPFPALDAQTLRAKPTFDAIDAALLDRLPLRDTALEVRGRITLDLFHDSLNPDVVLGSDGWLYFEPELMPCRGIGPVSPPADALDVLQATIAAAGRRPVITLVPSKVLIATRHRPAFPPGLIACADALERLQERRLRQLPGGVTIAPRLRELEARGVDTFLRTDTHLAAAGRELLVRGVLDAIQPGLADAAGIRPGREVALKGDLAGMVSVERSQRDPVVEATRTPDPPVRERVLLIADSQLERAIFRPKGGARPISERVLRDWSACTWQELETGDCAEPLRRADVVVLESVARHAVVWTKTCWRIASVLTERMAGRAGAYDGLAGGAASGDGGDVTFTGESVRLRVRPAGGAVAARPRVLRIPVRSLGGAGKMAVTQAPADGRALPCVSLEATRAGGAIVVPIPAGRDARQVELTLTAAPGARVGPPEELTLDARPPRG